MTAAQYVEKEEKKIHRVVAVAAHNVVCPYDKLPAGDAAADS